MSEEKRTGETVLLGKQRIRAWWTKCTCCGKVHLTMAPAEPSRCANCCFYDCTKGQQRCPPRK